MDDLTPGERAYADLAAEGVDEAALAAEMHPVPTQRDDGTLIITVFEDGMPLEVEVEVLQRVPNLRTSLGVALATQAKGMKATSFKNRVESLGSFVEFLIEKKLERIKPRHITNALLNSYRDWLDDYEKAETTHVRGHVNTVFPTAGGGKLKVKTKKSRMGQVLILLRLVRVDRNWWLEIGRDLDLIRADDWSGVAIDSLPVEILTRPQLKMVVRICREEITEITARLKDAWAVMDGQEPTRPMGQADREVMLEVMALHKRFEGRPPKQQGLSKALGEDKTSFPRLRRMKSPEYNTALATIYPVGRMLMPFAILFAIYFRYNRSVVTTMLASHFSEQPSPHGLRLRGMPFKNRAGRTQYASWPVTEDAHNPAEMIETLDRWTSLVRPFAGKNAGHMFLERIGGGKTRSLDDQYGFSLNFVRFLEDHETKIGRRFVFKALRASVINLVHHLFDGDLLATAEAGQHAVRTMIDHYLFDGARKLNEEALVPGLHSLDAWVRTNGRVDGREDKRRGSLQSVTPGFGCKDRYGCKLPGQSPGRLCTAYGMCPVCPLKKIVRSSAEAYALIVKLREAILRSRSRMPAETWIARWSAVLDRIDTRILRLFPDEVIDRADLNIPQLPTVE